MLIGEPAEDPTDEYGDDGNLLTLPHEGISIQHMTKIVNSTQTRLGIPGIAVAPTLREILSGQDPVLHLALAYQPSG